MNSELIGILGATMLAGVMGVFWLGRLQGKNVDAEDVAHGPTSSGAAGDGEDAVATKAYRIGLGMPDFAPQRADAQPAEEDVVDAVDVVEAVEVLAEPELPDCPGAELNLDIAAKLEVIGDYEGVKDMATLVAESASASKKQKAQAQNLLSRAT